MHINNIPVVFVLLAGDIGVHVGQNGVGLVVGAANRDIPVNKQYKLFNNILMFNGVYTRVSCTRYKEYWENDIN